jgi:hypothetical protein
LVGDSHGPRPHARGGRGCDREGDIEVGIPAVSGQPRHCRGVVRLVCLVLSALFAEKAHTAQRRVLSAFAQRGENDNHESPGKYDE